MTGPRRQTSGFPRVTCIVDGCHRGTTRIQPLEEDREWCEHPGRDPQWVCGAHWRQVPRTMKRRRSVLFRHWRKRWQRYEVEQTREAYEAAATAQRLIRAQWERIKASLADGGALDIAEIERMFG